MRRFALIGLAYAVALGAALRGADASVGLPRDDNAAPDRHVATIVMLDAAQRKLTLRAKGANYAFFLDTHVTNTVTHRPVALDELAPGQLIRFVSRPRSDGQLEIVALAILPNGAGSGSGGGSRGGPLEVSPFK
jgi:hypothetical protein